MHLLQFFFHSNLKTNFLIKSQSFASVNDENDVATRNECVLGTNAKIKFFDNCMEVAAHFHSVCF